MPAMLDGERAVHWMHHQGGLQYLLIHVGRDIRMDITFPRELCLLGDSMRKRMLFLNVLPRIHMAMKTLGFLVTQAI